MLVDKFERAKFNRFRQGRTSKTSDEVDALDGTSDFPFAVEVKNTFVHFDDLEKSDMRGWHTGPPGLTLPARRRGLTGKEGNTQNLIPSFNDSNGSRHSLDFMDQYDTTPTFDEYSLRIDEEALVSDAVSPPGLLPNNDTPAFIPLPVQQYSLRDPAIIATVSGSVSAARMTMDPAPGAAAAALVLPQHVPAWDMTDFCGEQQMWAVQPFQDQAYADPYPNRTADLPAEKAKAFTPWVPPLRDTRRLDEDMSQLGRLLGQPQDNYLIDIEKIEEGDDEDGDVYEADALGKAKRRRTRRKKAKAGGEGEAGSLAEVEVVHAEQPPRAQQPPLEAHETPFAKPEDLSQAIAADGEHRAEALTQLNGCFLDLVLLACRDEEWSRSLQKALDYTSTSETMRLFEELKGNFYKALSSRHANWIIRNALKPHGEGDEAEGGLITWLAGAVAKDLVDNNQVPQAARNEFASRTIWDLVHMHYTGVAPEHRGGASGSQASALGFTEDVKLSLKALVDTVLTHIRDFCGHQFANYVVQHVLECGEEEHRSQVAEVLRGNALKYANHKHGVHIVEKALQYCCHEQRQRIADELLDPGCLRQLVESKFGCFVARALLVHDEYKEEAVKGLRSLEVEELKVPKRGFELLEELLQGVVKLSAEAA